MDFTTTFRDRADDIVELFTRTFTASEGADEGRLIGSLVSDMIATVTEDDIRVFSCLEDGQLAGCIVFTRMRFDGDARTVFVLAPVAVAPERQRRGVGRSLLTFGLDELRKAGVDVALTYGDPAYYARVGFRRITPEEVPPPRPLAYPHGWLGQSLTDRPLAPLKGPSHCVGPLDRPEYW